MESLFSMEYDYQISPKSPCHEGLDISNYIIGPDRNQDLYGYDGYLSPSLTPVDGTMKSFSSTAPALTHKEIGEHNLENGGEAIWLMKYGKVYNVTSLHRQLMELMAINKGHLPEVCDADDIVDAVDEDDDDTCSELSFSTDVNPLTNISYCDIWKHLPQLPLLEEQIKQAMEAAYIADFQNLTIDDFRVEYQQEARALIQDICAELHTHDLSSLVEVLERSILTCRLQNVVPFGDPNTSIYFLPRDVYACDLRWWLQEWEGMDTYLGDNNLWRSPCYDVIYEEDADLVFRGSLRPWEDSPGFEHSITGEAAWVVIEENVIQLDQCTASQETVESTRKQRSDLSDIDRMKRRRRRLSKYFDDKYTIPTEAYSKWAENMETSWQEFQKLC